LFLAAAAAPASAQTYFANGYYGPDEVPLSGECEDIGPAPSSVAGAGPGIPPELFPIVPMGGLQNRDMWISNYRDLVPGGGKGDFACGARTYNGHSGLDSVLRSFAEQDIGVPVYAVLDGVVEEATDADDDRNTVKLQAPGANYIKIDHGNGVRVWYWHIRKGSSTVAAGHAVTAGQKIAEVGSSGTSTWPHLHMRVIHNGVTIDPFEGPCNVGTSWWRDQPIKNVPPVLIDFAATDLSPAGICPPDPWPRSKAISQMNAGVFLWVNIRHVQANSDIRFDFRQPDNVVAFTSGVLPFTETNWKNCQREWWGFDFPQLHATAGQWSVDIYLNGDLIKNVPMEVVPTSSLAVNDPPEAVGLSFWPACPQPSDVIQCRIATDLVLDDLDFDVLSYTYEWKLNNVPVQFVVQAGHADALPRGTVAFGDTLSCKVTPNDGLVDGPSTTISEVIGSHWISAYCTAGVTTNGCQAVMTAAGHASAAAPTGFVVTTSNVEANKQGLMFWGRTPKASPWGAGTSTLCVAAPTVRTPVQNSRGGIVSPCDGTFALDFNGWMTSNPARAPGAGETVYLQTWFRDPPAPKTTSLSDALQFPICP
jgi:murein DD-endopeptidase MepM/ murein hydrolase activator NlpD